MNQPLNKARKSGRLFRKKPFSDNRKAPFAVVGMPTGVHTEVRVDSNIAKKAPVMELKDAGYRGKRRRAVTGKQMPFFMESPLGQRYRRRKLSHVTTNRRKRKSKPIF